MSIANGTTYDEEAKIWYGPKARMHIFNPDCSIGKILFYMMKIKPKGIALQSDTEKTSVTYEELLTNSMRIAQHLDNLAPQQNDIIGIVSGHTTHVTSVLCASWFNATAVHPINPQHEQAVVQHLFGITRPKIIFCEGQYYQKVLKSCQALQLEAVIYTINDHIEAVPNILDLIKPTGSEESYTPKDLLHGGNQTICIVNSSGTTGLPKAVCRSNASLCFMGFISADDVIFAFSPLDWVTGIIFTIATIVGCGKRIITTASFTPQYFKTLMENHKITQVMLCPSYLSNLVNTPDIQKSLANLRTVFCGGGMMPEPVYRKFHKLLRPEQTILNCYGSSEFPDGVAVNYNAKKPNAVGQIMPGVKAKIVTDAGKQLGIGEVGEVLLHSEKTWVGYYNDPIATREMIDSELWFHTGDLGYFDADGDLFIVDRKKDVMKYLGVHYTPQEIEQVIARLPDVVEVCVFGNTNDLEGDRAAAAIVKQKDSKLTEDEVIQYVAKQFEVEWKRLHGGVFFMNSLPTTGSGKVKRRETKMQALQRLVAAG